MAIPRVEEAWEGRHFIKDTLTLEEGREEEWIIGQTTRTVGPSVYNRTSDLGHSMIDQGHVLCLNDLYQSHRSQKAARD